jgi:hypothetical protein
MPKREFFMDEEDLPQIRFSPKERLLLSQTAKLLQEVRELRMDEDDDLTTDVALAHYLCNELAQETVMSAW